MQALETAIDKQQELQTYIDKRKKKKFVSHANFIYVYIGVSLTSHFLEFPAAEPISLAKMNMGAGWRW